MADDALFELSKSLEDAKASLQKAELLLKELGASGTIVSPQTNLFEAEESSGDVIEGVFDGFQMIGPDGQVYAVPSNYASKSKLVEGDILKLRIQPDGTFLFKQIQPVERTRVKGILLRSEDGGNFHVLAAGRSYRVLTASVTYYKGEQGDEVIILVPEGEDSRWAAVENVVKAGTSGGESVELAGAEVS